MRDLLIHTVLRYLSVELVRFFFSTINFVLIFKLLSVEAYAQYVVLVSFSALVGVFLTLNCKGSMQKAFSKVLLRDYVALAFLYIIIFGLVITSIAFASYGWFNDRYSLALGSSLQLPVLVIFAFVASDALTTLVWSCLNALGKTAGYGVSTIIYPAVLCGCLLTSTELSINQLITFIIVSNLAAGLLGILLFYDFKVPQRFRLRLFLKCVAYILKYSWQTTPSNFLKMGFDYSAKITLASQAGDGAVATIGFLSNLLAIFRTGGSAVFRAATPIFMRVKGTSSRSFELLRFIVRIEVAVVITVFSLSILWLPVVSLLFSEKPTAVFDPVASVLLASTLALTQYKNLYLVFVKRHIELLRYAWFFAAFSYLIGLVAIFVFPISVNVYCLILIVTLLLNFLLIRYHPRGVRDYRSGISAIL